ncbi:60S ribosomal protein L23, putative [Plasmodium berghei]|uniref:60S ribosomal protein L23, putative n=2 Tax=Plasmodium berghei TaxID=5821 RepID=A0A509AQ33_PLABA|nr:60S ribosomal protein L23, putative [Plasmodium berghei ANKA]CXI98248.1 60S ribosomal protein L23, putative [Plasmodium berghei]SCL97683.1 60S ribosomal protein L23, putative [Plasmodium berghei]SCM16660.1 60S ribosomal protein L23, putative [Plasmodium berghei]SCM18457.1 60S ribosomal protein L23, putative [Plasmodium berghei]SCN27888.1 60S ribosomal protein L23, putative [Plasmodium berghei]|eukprot:XP_034423542.1 60S ribosomal protein L23, putative [Plasmodium berghei ANKA]
MVKATNEKKNTEDNGKNNNNAKGANDKVNKKKGMNKGKTVVKKTINKNSNMKADNFSQKKIQKMTTSIRFKRKKTLKLKKNPKCPKILKSCYKKTLDKYGIIKYPLTSEKAMKKIEEINTLVFICDKRADKRKIKKSVKSLFDIKCAKVNVLNRLNGDKKAYVRLSKDHDALEVANKIGIL